VIGPRNNGCSSAGCGQLRVVRLEKCYSNQSKCVGKETLGKASCLRNSCNDEEGVLFGLGRVQTGRYVLRCIRKSRDEKRTVEVNKKIHESRTKRVSRCSGVSPILAPRSSQFGSYRKALGKDCAASYFKVIRVAKEGNLYPEEKTLFRS